MFFSVVGFDSLVIVPDTGSGDLVTGTILSMEPGKQGDLLDASFTHPGDLRRILPKQLLVAPGNELKDYLHDLLRIHGLKNVKAKDLLKPRAKCSQSGNCVYSTHGLLKESAGFLTLSLECVGKKLSIKASRFADKLLDVLFNSLVELSLQAFKREGVRVERSVVEKSIASKLFSALKYYIQKYYIQLPDKLEVYGFYTHLD